MALSRDFQHGLQLSAAAYVAFAGGYVYHIVSSRWLGPVDYAVVGTAGSVFNVVVLLLGAVEMAVTRGLASEGLVDFSARSSATSHWSSFVTRFGIATTLSLLLVSVLLSPILHLGSPFPILVVALSVPGLCLATWRRAHLRSGDAFEAIASRIVVEKVISIVGVFALLTLGGGALGAIGANGAGFLAWIAGRATPVRRTPARSRTPVLAKPAGRTSAGSMIATYLAIGFVANLDVLIVQAKFPAVVAGQYAVVALFGRAVFLGILTLAGALIPKVASATNSLRAVRLLVQYTFLCLGTAVLAILFAAVAGRALLFVVFGSAFAPAAPLLVPQMMFAAAAGLQALFSSYAQARRLPGALAGQLVSSSVTIVLLLGATGVVPMLERAMVGELIVLVAYGFLVVARHDNSRSVLPIVEANRELECSYR